MGLFSEKKANQLRFALFNAHCAGLARSVDPQKEEEDIVDDTHFFVKIDEDGDRLTMMGHPQQEPRYIQFNGGRQDIDSTRGSNFQLIYTLLRGLDGQELASTFRLSKYDIETHDPDSRTALPLLGNVEIHICDNNIQRIRVHGDVTNTDIDQTLDEVAESMDKFIAANGSTDSTGLRRSL